MLLVLKITISRVHLQQFATQSIFSPARSIASSESWIAQVENRSASDSYSGELLRKPLICIFACKLDNAEIWKLCLSWLRGGY